MVMKVYSTFFLCSWVHASQLYLSTNVEQDATIQFYLYLQTALHVSGSISTHRQFQPLHDSDRWQQWFDKYQML